MELCGSVVVSWDFSHGRDQDIMLVGKQENGSMNVINVFQGPEVFDLWKKLTVREKKEQDDDQT